MTKLKTNRYYKDQLDLLNKNTDFNEKELDNLYNQMDAHIKSKNHRALRQDRLKIKAFIARCRQDIRLADKNIKEIQEQNEQARGNQGMD